MEATQFLNTTIKKKKKNFTARVIAVLISGSWFAGGSVCEISMDCRDAYGAMTDADKRKVHPTAAVLARIESTGRYVSFRDDELNELEIIDG